MSIDAGTLEKVADKIFAGLEIYGFSSLEELRETVEDFLEKVTSFLGVLTVALLDGEQEKPTLIFAFFSPRRYFTDEEKLMQEVLKVQFTDLAMRLRPHLPAELEIFLVSTGQLPPRRRYAEGWLLTHYMRPVHALVMVDTMGENTIVD